MACTNINILYGLYTLFITYIVWGLLIAGRFLSHIIPCMRKTSSSCSLGSVGPVASFQQCGRLTSITHACLATASSYKDCKHIVHYNNTCYTQFITLLYSARHRYSGHCSARSAMIFVSSAPVVCK